jgi:hypothetical protein
MLRPWPWKKMGIFLSLWWSCMILKLTVWSLSCLQGLDTFLAYTTSMDNDLHKLLKTVSISHYTTKLSPSFTIYGAVVLEKIFIYVTLLSRFIMPKCDCSSMLQTPKCYGPLLYRNTMPKCYDLACQSLMVLVINVCGDMLSWHCYNAFYKCHRSHADI